VAALDVSIQAQVLNLFMDLRAQRPDLPVHQPRPGRGAHLSDRVVIMYLGRVVEAQCAGQRGLVCRRAANRGVDHGQGPTHRHHQDKHAQPDAAAGHCVHLHREQASGRKVPNRGLQRRPAVVGTGPYKLVSHTPGDRTVFERSPSYWGPKPVWDKVTYRFINNGAARTAALLAGDVDVIDKVAVTDVEKLKKTPSVSVYTYPGLRVLLLQPSHRPGPNEFISDNAGKPLAQNPLTDVRVRQALSLAINRKAIVERVLQNTVTEANQWMPKGTFGYNPEVKDIPYNVEQAKKLLAEAGFPARLPADHPCAG
jgi:hypothetical protein